MSWCVPQAMRSLLNQKHEYSQYSNTLHFKGMSAGYNAYNPSTPEGEAAARLKFPGQPEQHSEAF